MSVDTLLVRLTRDAEEQARGLVTQAEARAEGIVAAAEAERTRRLEDELARVEATARNDVARDTAAAERTQRRRRLEVRARLLDQVFAGAEEILRDAPIASYEGGLGDLLEGTLRYLDGPVRVRCHSTAAIRLKLLLGQQQAHVVLAPDAHAAAGVLGEADDGRVRVDNTLVARLAQRREDLAPALLARIEGL